MKILKFIAFTVLCVCAGYVGSKGFSMPNSSAADMCYGAAVLLLIFAFAI